MMSIFQRIVIDLRMSSPEMWVSFLFGQPDDRRLRPEPSLKSPNGPQLLPLEVSACRENVRPVPSKEWPLMAVISSFSPSSKLPSSPSIPLEPTLCQSPHVLSPYLRKHQRNGTKPHLARMLEIPSPSNFLIWSAVRF